MDRRAPQRRSSATLHSTHTITGLSHDGDGKVDFSVRTELLDKSGKVVYSQPWKRNNADYSASTIRLNHSVGGLRPDQVDNAGTYKWRMQVEDHIAKRECESELLIELTMPQGVVAYALRCGHDQAGRESAGAAFTVGELIYIHGQICNFGVAEGKLRARITSKVLDSNGAPAKWPEFVREFSDVVPVYSKTPTENFTFNFAALESGKYLISIQVEDLIGGTSTTQTLPLQVSELPDWHLKAEPQLTEAPENRVKR